MKRIDIAICSRMLVLSAAVVFSLTASYSRADEKHYSRLHEDKQRVKAWNTFAKRLYTLDQKMFAAHELRTETSQGGYAGQPNLYTETRYYDKNSNHLLSRIQRMNHDPSLIMLIEVYLYNETGKVSRDYSAAYLPYNRNAPIQTLINLHAYHDGLHGFRQFDASGERIYEQCRGVYRGKSVMLSLEEDQITEGPYRDKQTLDSMLYKTCFADLPLKADKYLNPLRELGALQDESAAPADDAEQVNRQIEAATQKLKRHPRDVGLLVQRGDLYFKLHEFDQAILDYSAAIAIDDQADEAYFGRGMALGRAGQIKEGIADLTVYIRRHPDNARAYTKRGVRYLWLHDDQRAERDLARAIALNTANAEAHDDLGVIHARRGDFATALQHFQAAIQIDPTYFKAYHNQAMVLYIRGRYNQALASTNASLKLVPQQRNTLLLKADILQALGRREDSRRAREEAEFMPEGNWSEHISVK
jgi:tetratricopeptide (TPR) repeat protein